MPSNNWLRWIVKSSIALSIILLVIAIILYLVPNSHFNQIYTKISHPIILKADSATIAYGKHLVHIRGCTDCHGENLAGQWVLNDAKFARIYSSNLTPGEGGIGKTYTVADWERAIRHAIDPDGHPLLFMPAQEFFHLSNTDLAAIIAYLKTLSPVNHHIPAPRVGPLGRLLYLNGKVPLVPARFIDHTAPHPRAPMRAVSAAYGRYLAISCMGCHGQDFSGGPIPGAPPDWPPAANLTPAGNLKQWQLHDFIHAARTGIKPNGKPFAPQMPYRILKAMTDEELQAVWMFLQSLPAEVP